MIGLMGSGGNADPFIRIGAQGGYNVSYGFGQPSVTTIRLANDGYVYYAQRLAVLGDVFSNVGEWAASGATASAYEVRATLTDSSGDGVLGGTFGSWLNLGTTRDWTLTDNSADTSGPDGGTATATILIQIRDAATQRIRGSTTFIMTAQRYS